MPAARRPTRPARRWRVPEVVQTSAMDCGPAALASLLQGHGIRAAYGRLREACQTDVDGTSIDTVEAVANRLGLPVEQSMIPLDHLLLAEAKSLPAMVVVRLPDGATHFVLVWRRRGARVQVMDPATGRRWMRIDDLAGELFRHELSVPSSDWRDWAGSADFTAPLGARLHALGADRPTADAMISQALAVPHWFAIATLDAAVRLAASMHAAGGLPRGAAAMRLIGELARQTWTAEHDIFRLLPPAYWSVVPDPRRGDDGRGRLLMRGVVLLRVLEGDTVGTSDAAGAAAGDGTGPTVGASAWDAAAAADRAPPALSRELAAALAEPPPRPLADAWRLLREDGRAAPLALAGAAALAALATAMEAVLFRGLFDVAALLARPDQRALAMLALLVFIAALFALEVPIAAEAQRLGRRLELRLRMALLRKLPRLGDRYFQSRPVSDMAERGHAITGSRMLPTLALQLLQAAAEGMLVLTGIALLDPASLPWALALGTCALALPALVQPMINERDLRLRSLGGALHGVHLDSLLGGVPIRAHRAARAVLRRHEALLAQWTLAGRSLLAWSTAADAIIAIACTGLAVALLGTHFLRSGGVTGAELLLVYWTLKLPAIAGRLAGLARQYPAQRSLLLRLTEPLSAPESAPADPLADADTPARAASAAPASRRTTDPAAASPGTPMAGVGLTIADGRIVAGGHTLLDGVDLHIAPGEHVAIVGASGAGKSTLVALLMGWHRLAEGDLRIDGGPAVRQAPASLRARVAWVDPAVQLWNASMADNLVYASEDEALGRLAPVLAAADLRGLVRALPQGLQTLLGEGGGLLSGGEGQRVRLGRALLQRDAGLVLLDEPFRGLDRPRRETLMREARHWWRTATLLCVSHDVADTQAFDRVIVVDGGRIVEDGAPAALLARDGPYAALTRAEAALRAAWSVDDGWRRLTVRDGRIDDEPAGRPRTRLRAVNE